MRTFLNCFLVMTVIGFCGSLAAADHGHRDGYVFRGGKVLMFKEGRESAVTAEVTLHNGARILPDGFIVYKDGRRERFVEDRWIGFDGEFIVADAEPVFVDDFDGYYVESGRVYVVRDRRPVLVTTEVVFTDGSRLSPDGFIVLKGGGRTRLENGQRFSREGRRLEVKAAVRTGDNNRNERAIDTSRKVEDRTGNRQVDQKTTTTTEKRETTTPATPATPATPSVEKRETPPANPSAANREHAAENRERATEKREAVQERHEEKRESVQEKREERK